jgi:hypothetical protein
VDDFKQIRISLSMTGLPLIRQMRSTTPSVELKQREATDWPRFALYTSRPKIREWMARWYKHRLHILSDQPSRSLSSLCSPELNGRLLITDLSTRSRAVLHRRRRALQTLRCYSQGQESSGFGAVSTACSGSSHNTRNHSVLPCCPWTPSLSLQ